MPGHVAYYRVSTEQQGVSGLGLDAQRLAVARFLETRGSPPPLADFTEIESGKKDDKRPELAAALAECRRLRATLLISKLDRLARNVAFIANLMKSNVPFVAIDMPEANNFQLHVMAAFAEHEREVISQRTKAALHQVKLDLAKNGTRTSRAGRVFSKLGHPRPEEAVAAMNAAKATTPLPPENLALLRALRARGKGLREIARELNRQNIRTPRGKQWYAQTVKRLIFTEIETVGGN